MGFRHVLKCLQNRDGIAPTLEVQHMVKPLLDWGLNIPFIQGRHLCSQATLHMQLVPREVKTGKSDLGKLREQC